MHSYLNASSNKGTLTSKKQKVPDTIGTSISEIGRRKMHLCFLNTGSVIDSEDL